MEAGVFQCASVIMRVHKDLYSRVVLFLSFVFFYYVWQLGRLGKMASGIMCFFVVTAIREEGNQRLGMKANRDGVMYAPIGRR